MNVQNLGKFEWENEIPFPIDTVNKTLHAVLGEGKEPRSADFVLGLISSNKENRKWNLNTVSPTHNDVFGMHGFGQINSSFSITVKAVNETTTNLEVVVSARQGNVVGGNLSFLQSECEAFITALSYYLEHQDIVKDWEENYKPQSLANKEKTGNSGCASVLLIPLMIGLGGIISCFIL